MMAVTTLGALADGGVLAIGDGYRTKGSEYDDAGIPILRVADVLEGKLAPSFKDRVSLARLPQIGPKQSRPRDVIVTTKGSVGRVALIPESLPSHVYSPQLCYLRVEDPSLVDYRWLYSWARSPQFQRQTGSVKDQTDMAPYVSLGDLRRFRIQLPPLSEQRRIAEVLGALDDLIDTNERLTADAAELRRSLLAAALGVATEHHALSSIARFVNGKNFTKGADGTGRPIVRTPEVREGVKSATLRSSVEATDDFIARGGDLLFVWSGSLCLGRWGGDEALVNQHVFKVIPNAGMPDWYVYACLEWKLPWFLGLAADKATKMGHIQRAHLASIHR